MFEKLNELQKSKLSKNQIFEKLKRGDIHDVFLSKELAEIPEYYVREKFNFWYSVYISFFAVKVFVLFMIRIDFSSSIMEEVGNQLLEAAAFFSIFLVYYWRHWSQKFFLGNFVLDICVLLLLVFQNSWVDNYSYLFVGICLDIILNLILSKLIHGATFFKRIIKIKDSELYDFNI